MKFILEIELGNDAMQTPEDVADALRRAAHHVDISQMPADGRTIHDANGNTVGKWEVSQ